MIEIAVRSAKDRKVAKSLPQCQLYGHLKPDLTLSEKQLGNYCLNMGGASMF